jgi:hypothetical protein
LGDGLLEQRAHVHSVLRLRSSQGKLARQARPVRVFPALDDPAVFDAKDADAGDFQRVTSRRMAGEAARLREAAAPASRGHVAVDLDVPENNDAVAKVPVERAKPGGEALDTGPAQADFVVDVAGRQQVAGGVLPALGDEVGVEALDDLGVASGHFRPPETSGFSIAQPRARYLRQATGIRLGLWAEAGRLRLSGAAATIRLQVLCSR